MDIPKNFDFSRETEIYKRWRKNNYFSAAPTSAKQPYTIMIPPPNITDKLHMGHALNNTIQDILIRTKRMQGFEALYLPGTDHASIATEVIVTKNLAAQGQSKQSLGREAFLQKMWDWNHVYGGIIIKQLQRLGFSCDWGRQRFTMDEGLSDAVLSAFEMFYNDGLIYRDYRLINWCTTCRTSISDAEVAHKDGQGSLYHFAYPLVGGGRIEFATTRPETMPADVAIAVNPDDGRYAHLIGRMAKIPFCEREIPVIADKYVSMDFGTGAVKITPGHDPNDFEIGKRHNLPTISIMGDDGILTADAEQFCGMTMSDARAAILQVMQQAGHYIKTVEIVNSVGRHDRCNTVVEPKISLQWFVKMDELARPALQAYTDGKLTFNRERFGKIYANWLHGIRDWCISRQLWWGHRIPAYYCPDGHITVSKKPPQQCSTCQSTTLVQDEDVLDTWFSSGLWPFSTLGWPVETAELDYFYPTNVLVTAPEIIFFWVVRMVFMGQKITGKLPFSQVFIHGIVRDEQGRKMSKSLGNGVDPLEIADEFGADVLRLMLVSGTALDSDTRFSRKKLEPARNFLNKLYNATRYVLLNIADFPADDAEVCLAAEDKWILSRMNDVVNEVTEKIEQHELGLAVQAIVDFVWDTFCDWYVEMTKPRLRPGADADARAAALRRGAQKTLARVLDSMLRLLHPITPFITEDLFLALQKATVPKGLREETIMRASWPVHDAQLEASQAVRNIARITEGIRMVRAMRVEKGVAPAKKIDMQIVADDDLFDTMQESHAFIALLCGAANIAVCRHVADAMPNAASVVAPGATYNVSGLVDVQAEQARLLRERKKLEGEIARLDARLGNEGFVRGAPPELVAAEREKLHGFSAMLNEVNALLDGFDK